MLVVMVRIPVGSAEEGERLQERFRQRAGLVDNQPGFLGFELLKSQDEHEVISVTRWASREDLDRWMSSAANAEAHAKASSRSAPGHPVAGSGDVQPEGAGNGHRPSSTTIYEVVIPVEARR